MQPSNPTTIADLSFQYRQRFMDLSHEISSLRNVDSQDRDSFPDGFVPEANLDSFARFRVWAGNIGALQKNKSSLDYRIHHSTVRHEVTRLLTQLSSALADLKSLVTREREQQTWFTSELIPLERPDGASESSESESDFSDPEEDSVQVTESSQLSLITDDTIASLLKLSIVIQKSSKQAKFARSSRERQYDSHYDILHVKESFPYSANNDSLVEKLGKANAQRRQWISYSRRHREKLSSKLDSSEGNTDLLSQGNRSAHDATAVSFSSCRPQSFVTDEVSTRATTFIEEPYHARPEGVIEEAASETSYSASSALISVREKLQVPQIPPESADGRPFECALCCTILCVESLQSWIKHVHTDLASYVCTFEHCTQPLFESRHQWFQHEMEVHRRIWPCQFCDISATSLGAFENHLKERHHELIGKEQIASLAQLAGRQLDRIPASACPLCDYNTILQGRLVTSENIFIRPARFRSHLGRHLEQLALFVLPKESLVQDDDDGLPPNTPSDAESIASEGDDEQIPREEDVQRSLEGLFAAMAINPDHTPHILNAAPDLALGWQPPHDFTPPAADFETEDPDMIPRREESTFGGDLFTPGWVRGYNQQIQGFCGRCKDRHWANIIDGTYEFHLTYMYGIPSTGLPLPRPSIVRQAASSSRVWEGYCGYCRGWRTLKRTRRGWNWFRHCLTEHKSSAPSKTSGEPIMDAGSFPSVPLPTINSQIRNAIDYIRKGDLHAYKSLVDGQPTLVLQQDSTSKFLLHYAAEAGPIGLVLFTLQIHDAQGPVDSIRSIVDAKSPNKITPMMLAAGQGNYEAVEELLKAGSHANFMNAEGRTALDFAVDAGHFSISELLVINGAEIKRSKALHEIYLQSPKQKLSVAGIAPGLSKAPHSDTTGWNELMISAHENKTADVERHLVAGIDVEANAPDGRTALMICTSRANHDVVEILLAAGANIDATNNKGWTALMIAVKDADHSTASLLLSHGAELNHLSPDHWTALAEAAQQRSTAIMKSLLECGADTESKSSHDWTPLMHACYIGDKDGVHLLLAASADVENGSQRDETPMLLAAAKGHTDIVRTLLDAGGHTELDWARKVEAGFEAQLSPASANRAYPLGWTPLMVACQGGHEEVVDLLLDRGANVEPRSPMERTVLQIAQENGRTRIVEMLEEHNKSQAR